LEDFCSATTTHIKVSMLYLDISCLSFVHHSSAHNRKVPAHYKFIGCFIPFCPEHHIVSAEQKCTNSLEVSRTFGTFLSEPTTSQMNNSQVSWAFGTFLSEPTTSQMNNSQVSWAVGTFLSEPTTSQRNNSQVSWHLVLSSLSQRLHK
jgi:hypothetical protein